MNFKSTCTTTHEYDVNQTTLNSKRRNSLQAQKQRKSNLSNRDILSNAPTNVKTVDENMNYSKNNQVSGTLSSTNPIKKHNISE